MIGKAAALAGCLLAALGSWPAQAQTHRAHGGASAHSADHIYYNISEDPDSLQLLALSDSCKVGGAMMMDVTDVYRSPKMLVGNTWRIDCGGERMGIVHTTRVQPGSPVEQLDVSPPTISTRASAKAWRIYQLACTGRGDLVERRIYRGELGDIVQRFWGG